MASVERESLNRREQLLRDLDDVEYRKAFVEGLVKDTVAFQLRGLRKEEHLEQRDVAARLGNADLQPMISRYENPDYGRYSVSTLLDLAAALDVALIVRFATFSELLEWNLSSDSGVLTPASYAKDKGLSRIEERLHRERGIAANQNSLDSNGFNATVSTGEDAANYRMGPTRIKKIAANARNVDSNEGEEMEGMALAAAGAGGRQ